MDWARGSDQARPHRLDASILFAPVGGQIPAALAVTTKDGTVVCGGIHMSEVPSFPYSLLWGEHVVRSIADLTRDDARRFLALAPQMPVRTITETFPLTEANEARRGSVQAS